MAIRLDPRNIDQAETAIDFMTSILQASTEYALIGMSLDGTIELWNEGARRVYGYTSQDVVANAHWSILCPRQKSGLQRTEWTESALRHGKWEATVEHRRRNGELFTARVVVTPRRNEAGIAIGFLLICKDISPELGLAEQSQKSGEGTLEQFEALANGISNLCWMANTDGWIFWYNRRWYEYTGTTPQDMEGWRWKSVHDPAELPNVLERWTASIATGEPFEMTFPLRGADGVFRPFLTRVMPVKNPDGTVARWFGTNTDVTEQKCAEEMLRKRTEELLAANKELETFSYSVSHDLRAPLRHLMGFSELLREREIAGLSPAGLRYLDIISEEAQRMGTLIDELLSFSRSGRTELTLQPIALSVLVDEVIQSLAPDTLGRDIRWEIGPLPTVHADKALLRGAVLTNLVHNAIKFTRQLAQARIDIGYTETADEFIVFVRDNGAGFDMTYVDKLFGVFARLHARDQFEGVGIGLANVRRIITRHGGRAWADGSVGQGATFYFSLPKTPIASERVNVKSQMRNEPYSVAATTESKPA